jgi:hypothetical protein
VIFITIAAMLGRLVEEQWALDKEYLSQLVKTEMDPATYSKHAVVLSVLLEAMKRGTVQTRSQSANSQKQFKTLSNLLDCQDYRTGDCHDFFDLKQRLIGLDALWSTGSPDEKVKAIARLGTEYSEDLKQDLIAMVQKKDPKLDVNNCPYDPHNQARSDKWRLNLPVCLIDHVTHTAFMLPATESDAGNPENKQKRIEQGVETAKLFSIAAGTVIRTNSINPSEVHPRLVAMYYITVDSLIAYWTRDTTPTLSALPTYRLWAAREYFEKLLKDLSSENKSHLYLDYAGNGIIETSCEAVGTSPYTGAVCADFALPPDAFPSLVSAINLSPIARAELWSFDASGPHLEQSREVDVSASVERLSDSEQGVENNLKAAVEGDKSDQLREIQQLPGGGGNYLVPLASSSGALTKAVVISFRGVGPFGSRPLLLAFTLVSFIAALIALFAGFRASRAIAKREEVLSRLRSLQYAVIETDAKDEITAGNDRAEELLNRTLPAFGVREEERGRLSFWDVFDEDKIMFLKSDRDLFVGAGPPDPSVFERKSRKAITAARAKGKRSCYFAYNKSLHAWLMIKAGPVFGGFRQPLSSQDKEVPLSQTFGVLETVDPNLESVLNKLAGSL